MNYRVRVAAIVLAVAMAAMMLPKMAQAQCDHCVFDIHPTYLIWIHWFETPGLLSSCLFVPCHAGWDIGRCKPDHDTCTIVENSGLIDDVRRAAETEDMSTLRTLAVKQGVRFAFDQGAGELQLLGCEGEAADRFAVSSAFAEELAKEQLRTLVAGAALAVRS